MKLVSIYLKPVALFVLSTQLISEMDRKTSLTTWDHLVQRYFSTDIFLRAQRLWGIVEKDKSRRAYLYMPPFSNQMETIVLSPINLWQKLVPTNLEEFEGGGRRRQGGISSSLSTKRYTISDVIFQLLVKTTNLGFKPFIPTLKQTMHSEVYSVSSINTAFLNIINAQKSEPLLFP